MKPQLKNGIVFLIITATVLFLFNQILSNLNSTYFATGGDGLKAYYGAIYHNNYDKSYHHFNGMNHPYGENIFFTGSQPPISNTVKFIDENIIECSGYIVGIMNGMMIASIILGIFFLYLIFRRFKIPAWYSALVAIGIGLLSPQLGRLGGHFSLSWMLWIPLELYLLQLIQEKRTWQRSVIFGITTLLAGMMHLYFFMFSGFLLLFYWGNQFISKKDKLKSIFPYLHVLIQLLIPFLLIQLLMGQYDTVTDRTGFPWGFYSYRAYPGSVLLPVNKWYVPFISELGFTRKYSWEAFSYTGIIASLGFIAIILLKIISKKSKRSFSDNPYTEVWFWASAAALLFSMGIPFILGLDKLRLILGPVAQIRALGRFAWLFYYVLNIIVFIKLYEHLRTNKIRNIYKSFIYVAVIGILFFEAYDNTRVIKSLNNKIPSFTQAANTNGTYSDLPFDKNKYQAIMPLPYFHIGSESSWIEPKCGMAQKIFTASLSTGLPTNAVMLSRTSLSQTYKNIALTLTPWKTYEVLDDYQSEKPVLLMVASCDQLNENERRLIRHSSLVDSEGETKFYSLEVDSLRAIPGKYNFPARYHSVIDSIKILDKDTLAHISYVATSNETLKIKAPAKHQRIFENPVNLNPEKPVFIRFWVKNYNHDLVARTQLLVIQSKPDHQTIEEKYTDIFRNIRTIDGDWALVEIKLQPQQKSQIFKILIRNKDINGKPLYFKEFTISQLKF
ncbi:MAG: hypothetical protein PF486_04455 [Prolixibacteraceae bacterium]|jgi:hypothetical protein|nr:hypothetical protein [Prolixibacteraceae bacterium]